jgi:hypothetical protein
MAKTAKSLTLQAPAVATQVPAARAAQTNKKVNREKTTTVGETV